MITYIDKNRIKGIYKNIEFIAYVKYNELYTQREKATYNIKVRNKKAQLLSQFTDTFINEIKQYINNNINKAFLKTGPLIQIKNQLIEKGFKVNNITTFNITDTINSTSYIQVKTQNNSSITVEFYRGKFYIKEKDIICAECCKLSNAVHIIEQKLKRADTIEQNKKIILREFQKKFPQAKNIKFISQQRIQIDNIKITLPYTADNLFNLHIKRGKPFSVMVEVPFDKIGNIIHLEKNQNKNIKIAKNELEI